MRSLLLLAAVLLGLVVLLPQTAHTSSTGSPPQFSGGPFDNGTCTMCHGGSPVNSGTSTVLLEAPDMFVPGETYTLTITVDNQTPTSATRVQGFQISVQTATQQQVGELIVTDPVNTQYAANFPPYVTHTFTGRTQTTWSVDWTAPALEEAPATATIYVAVNAANGDSSPSGDLIYTVQHSMGLSTSTEGAQVAGRFSLGAPYPNPARAVARLPLTLEQALPVTVEVLDGRGRRVQAEALGVLPAGPHSHALPTERLAPGLYFARVVTPDGALVQPFTVVR